MKGTKKFTPDEVDQIKILISEKVRSSSSKQKSIRNRIRKLGFYISDYLDKKGYNVSDFQELINSGAINVIVKYEGVGYSHQNDNLIRNNSKVQSTSTKDNVQYIENQLIIDGCFIKAKDIDECVPNCTGFYCIRLISNSVLPKKYQTILEDREHRIIYIGKAEGQTLRKRFLNQELRAIGHGTFFRSIGAVLGYKPQKGSLRCDQKNYQFKDVDVISIVKWINENLEVNWLEFKGHFGIEKDLIIKYKPLLNINHNPLKLSILENDRKECLKIARSKKYLEKIFRNPNCHTI